MKNIRLTAPDSQEKVSHLGYLLHNLYCALEDIFREVAQTFENRVDDPLRYHRELLMYRTRFSGHKFFLSRPGD